MKSLDELIERTAEAVNGGSNRVVVSVPSKRRKGKYCYPLGRGTPKAELLSTNRDRDVVAFNAIDLLAFLIVVKAQEGEE